MYLKQRVDTKSEKCRPDISFIEIQDSRKIY